MLKWRLFQVMMAALVAVPFGFVILFQSPRWLKNVVAYPVDSSMQIVRDYNIDGLLFGRVSQGAFLNTILIIAYAYFFVLSLLLIIALAKFLRWRKGRASGQQTSG